MYSNHTIIVFNRSINFIKYKTKIGSNVYGNQLYMRGSILFYKYNNNL
jgi:hypothetical protein